MARKQRRTPANRISAIIGALLLAVACVWFVTILWNRHGVIMSVPLMGSGARGVTPTATSMPQITPLLAEGITITNASQQPGLSQQQALLLASELEPDAATQAKGVSARFVLVSYTSPDPKTVMHANFSNMPVWLIWYQHIPLVAASTSVDPTPQAQAYRDLYVFIDASSGKEIMAVSA